MILHKFNLKSHVEKAEDAKVDSSIFQVHFELQLIRYQVLKLDPDLDFQIV